jgi:DNA-binding CsgD family transcriptional regulator
MTYPDPQVQPAAAPPVVVRNAQADTRKLFGLILFQVLTTLFFLIDVSRDMAAAGLQAFTDPHLLPELGAVIGLIIGILVEGRFLMGMLRRQAQMARDLRVAAGALNDLMADYFRSWSLTPSEQDVAAFTIKGYSIAEVAAFRKSAEGTVKTHLNAIYRKAGVAGRAQLVSLLVEDLLRTPLIGAAADPRQAQH